MTDFKKILMKHKLMVDSEIKKFFSKKTDSKDSVKKYYHLLQNFVLNGGKRLRPVAMMMTYIGLGGKKNISKLSLSVEFFHNATLIEDDIMDEDDFRRNRPTIYKIFKDNFLRVRKEKKYKGPLFNKESSRTAVSNAILMANILYSFGAECLSEGKFIKESVKFGCLEAYNEAFIKVNEGQFDDLMFERKPAVSEKEYLKMAKLKSAHLVKASMELGAILAGANKKQHEALSKYAFDMTIAFQIQDDLMDINPNSKKGHHIGSDIVQGKKTLPIIKALELGNSKERKAILKVLGNPNTKDKSLKKAIEAMHTSGAVNYCQEFNKKSISKGKKWLKKAGLNKESEDFFLELADYVINRNI